MLVGVPKEIKSQEYRVGLVPASVKEIIKAGGRVLVETKAGEGIKISDQAYQDAGAEIIQSADELYQRAELIVKVKEPQPIECTRLREGQTIFTYLHLAPDPQLTKQLQNSGVTAIAYETVTQKNGGLPLLMPMSEVAGRMSIQAGAHCMETAQGGSGKLLGGVAGVPPAEVIVLGGGVVGTQALRMAIGMGAHVTVLDKSLDRLRELDFYFGSKLTTVYATRDAVERFVCMADLVIGAVLVPGAAAPKLVSREMLKQMQPGSVMIDVAIDQGGCFETSQPTTHHQPTFMADGIVHYCVTNMPGAVPRTSTFALNNATLPFILDLVSKGVKHALLSDNHLRNGLNIHAGKITYEAIASEFGLSYVPALDALS